MEMAIFDPGVRGIHGHWIPPEPSLGLSRRAGKPETRSLDISNLDISPHAIQFYTLNLRRGFLLSGL
jgi:hypothetical protein